MLDTKEERKYEQLRKLAQELHIPIPEAFWTLEVFDKDGKLIQRHHQRSHSWVRNAYNLLFCTMACKAPSDAVFGAGKLNIKDTGGVTESGANYPLFIIMPTQNPDAPSALGYLANAGDDDHGILAGSGTNAESFEDYVLQTPLAEGTGAGQISHVASELHSMSYAALVLTDELIRYFNNNSDPAGDRNINEVALVTRGYVDNTSKYWVQSRDKLASTVTVPVTGQLKVTYTVQLTYPS